MNEPGDVYHCGECAATLTVDVDRALKGKDVKRCGCVMDAETRLLRAIFGEASDCAKHRARWIVTAEKKPGERDPFGWFIGYTRYRDASRRRFRDAYTYARAMKREGWSVTVEFAYSPRVARMAVR
jgi:hypothetical protein